MVDPSLVETLQTNLGAGALLLYIWYEIRFGRVGEALDTMEERIERNALASRYLARANPNANAEKIDDLLNHDGDIAPLSDDVILDPAVHDPRTPADGEDE